MSGPVLYKLLMMENQEEKGMKWMEMRKNSVPVIKSRESGMKNKTANTSKEQSGRRQLLAAIVARMIRKYVGSCERKHSAGRLWPCP